MGSGVTGVTQILPFVVFFLVDSVSAPRASFAPSHFDNSIAVRHPQRANTRRRRVARLAYLFSSCTSSSGVAHRRLSSVN